jgi:hypothetical protein
MSLEKAEVHLSLKASLFKLESDGVGCEGWDCVLLSSWLEDGKGSISLSVGGCTSYVEPSFDNAELRRMSLTSV